jgi:hypothetical protein
MLIKDQQLYQRTTTIQDRSLTRESDNHNLGFGAPDLVI